jgi:drug/metabolite transporter (DMT)-like permease
MWYITFMLPFVLALAASAAWGSADYLGGRASRGMSAFGVATLSKTVGALGLALVCVALGEWPSGAEAAWALGAGLSGAVALPALYRALALGPMSLVAPLTACGGAVPVIVALAGGEVPGPITSGGLVVAFVGAVVVSRPAHPEAAVPGMRRVALGYALAAALAIGLALTLLQQGAQAEGDSALGMSLVAAVTTATILAAVTATSSARDRAERRFVLPPPSMLAAVAACGVLDVTANALFAQASADGRAAVVAVLGSLYPLATVLMARAWLGERLSTSQGAGVVAAMAGVAAIAAGG